MKKAILLATIIILAGCATTENVAVVKVDAEEKKSESKKKCVKAKKSIGFRSPRTSCNKES